MTPLDLTALIFTFMLGACVGSFLNVVVYRLPAGESLLYPPSHCPRCGYHLAWFDNIPIFAWLWLRARCRKCHTPISIQYPIIELLTALLFAGAYWVFYLSGMWPAYQTLTVMLTWPAFAAYVILIAGLLAATLIDARYFIIPLQIPWFVTIAAAILFPLTRYIEYWHVTIDRANAVPQSLPMPAADVALGAVGAMAGLLLANLLIYTGLLPRSFTEFVFDENPKLDDADVFLPHPHPRREMLKECLFLALPIAGFFIGRSLIDPAWTGLGWLGPAERVLAGVMLGYLGGGAVVWATRILGTLAFGKEAMGLGDVHLMAAVGAVAGWQTAVLAFFIAPFFGLAWAIASAGAQKLLKRQVRMIPYGPHLALASVLVIACHPYLMAWFSGLLAGPANP